MFPAPGVAALAAILAFGTGVEASGMYTKNSPVLQVDAKNYDSLISRSNHTSIVEFYAPWCGHCQNLKPAYEKAASSLQGLAKVAAVNCDDDANKPFCGSMGVQGFPTLKIVRPSKKAGRPTVEDYQGARTAKAIVDAVVDKIPNHVKRLGDKDIASWLSENNETSKAILFSNKGTTSALLKALAVDFLGGISIAQVRDKEKETVAMFGITEFPTLVLLPGGDKESLVYDGEIKKEPMSGFLSQVSPPNPDPAPKRPKLPKKEKAKDQKVSADATAKLSRASDAHASAQASKDAEGGSSIILEETAPTESPDPIATPDEAPAQVVIEDVAPPLKSLADEETLATECLGEKTSTCILALLPSGTSNSADTAIASIAEIAHKYSKRNVNIFPFFTVPATNPEAGRILSALELVDSEMNIVALNSRRHWWRRYAGAEFSTEKVEAWIDTVRLGEGERESLPEDLVKNSQNDQHDEL